ncbi:MAG TPA: hypothetical protein VL984_15170 [Acidimicrobiales bacterium]|nr:hypothetical protein [Acidimicrobiales bacterium]
MRLLPSDRWLNAEARRLVRDRGVDGLRQLLDPLRTALLEDPIAAQNDWP